jgi:hypothetical protein
MNSTWAHGETRHSEISVADQISMAPPDAIFGTFLIALMYLMAKGAIGLLDFIAVRLRRAVVAKRQNRTAG